MMTGRVGSGEYGFLSPGFRSDNVDNKEHHFEDGGGRAECQGGRISFDCMEQVERHSLS